MMIPSTKQILLFFTLNFLLIVFFNILLFKITAFLTYESFNTIFTLNTNKIVMLVSVFILTCFILNLVFLKSLLGSDYKRLIITTAKTSIGVILVGIIFASVIYICKGI